MKPAIPRLPSNLVVISAGDFIDEASLEACRLSDTDLTDVTARAISLDEVMLEKVTLAHANLHKSTSRDLVAESCDFSAVRCTSASFQRTIIKAGRMTGFDCSESLLKDVMFVSCKLDMANFRFTKLKAVQFKDCVLTDADFVGAKLIDVQFENCIMERTVFNNCTLHAVDLRSSQLIDIRGWQFLKGACIDSVQLMAAAPYLANELGITIID